jgi:RNA polymerase sigma-70 factor, ECF subfamily
MTSPDHLAKIAAHTWAASSEQTMDRQKTHDLTDLLRRFRRGDRTAEERLFPLLYDELRQVAVRHMRRERPAHSLQPTALVNEAYLRLINQRAKSWQNRAHFFACAAGLMREILIDHARRRRAAKRGEGKPHITLDGTDAQPLSTDDQLENVLAIDEALTGLAEIDPRQARIVELRFFAGMTSKEIAQALDINERTVDREWATARAWLYTRLRSMI